jgi:hypothetical protein
MVQTTISSTYAMKQKWEGEIETQKVLQQNIPKERRKYAALWTTKFDISNSGSERTGQET